MGFSKYNSVNSLNDDLKRKFKDNNTENWIKTFYDLIDADTGAEIGFKRYELKNDNVDRAIFFTGGYDSDIIRQCVNWIADNKQYFGNTILDVGCDIGIMSCYLASYRLFCEKFE